LFTAGAKKEKRLPVPADPPINKQRKEAQRTRPEKAAVSDLLGAHLRGFVRRQAKTKKTSKSKQKGAALLLSMLWGREKKRLALVPVVKIEKKKGWKREKGGRCPLIPPKRGGAVEC